MSKHNRHGHSEHSQTQQQEHDISNLTQDAQALLAATADVAGEKVVVARKRLSDSLRNVRDTIIENAKSADKAVRDNPYKAIGIAVGVGVLVGALMGRRRSRAEDGYDAD
jgi:ElaB/YqjD/DUF883 family membrane-anchored ribosome-binding protein